MKVQYNNGIVDHVQNDLGRSLINSGQATEVLDRSIKKTYATPAVSWEIVIHPFVGVRFCFGEVACSDSSRRKQYSPIYYGHPDNVNAKRTWTGGERYIEFGREVPEEIVKKYREAWKANKNLRAPLKGSPEFSVPDAEVALQNAQRQNIINNSRASAEFAATQKDTDIRWPE